MSKEYNASESLARDLNLVAVRLSPHGDYRPDPVDVLVHNPTGGRLERLFLRASSILTCMTTQRKGQVSKGGYKLSRDSPKA